MLPGGLPFGHSKLRYTRSCQNCQCIRDDQFSLNRTPFTLERSYLHDFLVIAFRPSVLLATLPTRVFQMTLCRYWSVPSSFAHPIAYPYRSTPHVNQLASNPISPLGPHSSGKTAHKCYTKVMHTFFVTKMRAFFFIHVVYKQRSKCRFRIVLIQTVNTLPKIIV